MDNFKDVRITVFDKSGTQEQFSSQTRAGLDYLVRSIKGGRMASTQATVLTLKVGFLNLKKKI